MRTGQHYCPETLLAGMDTALAKLVILASAVLAQEERPFQTPFLAPAHKSPSTGGFFYGAGLSALSFPSFPTVWEIGFKLGFPM